MAFCYSSLRRLMHICEILWINPVNIQVLLTACYVSSPVVNWDRQTKFKTWLPQWMDHWWLDKIHTKQSVNETKLN